TIYRKMPAQMGDGPWRAATRSPPCQVRIIIGHPVPPIRSRVPASPSLCVRKGAIPCRRCPGSAGVPAASPFPTTSDHEVSENPSSEEGGTEAEPPAILSSPPSLAQRGRAKAERAPIFQSRPAKVDNPI